MSFSFERTLNSNSQYNWLFLWLHSTLFRHSKHKLCLAVLCVNTFSHCFIGSLQENVSNSFYYIVSLLLNLYFTTLFYILICFSFIYSDVSLITSVGFHYYPASTTRSCITVIYVLYLIYGLISPLLRYW